MINLLGAPDRLSPVRRCRILARRFLYSALQAVPSGFVEAVHGRWITADGRSRPAWAPLAKVLFYRPLSGDTITVPGGAGERLVAGGTRLERTLWWYGEGGYEGSEAAWWRRLCARADDVLEIGTNIGYYAVVGAAATSGCYTAIEPNPEAAALARRNLAVNGIEHVTVIEGAAVADGEVGEVELALPDQESFSTAPTGSFLRNRAEGMEMRPASRSITVPALSASALFCGRDLVKLDIEGSEAAVLQAALPEVRRSRPTLLIELLPGSGCLRSLLMMLEAEGWRTFSLGPDSTLLPTHASALPGSRDVLLVPEERVDDL